MDTERQRRGRSSSRASSTSSSLEVRCACQYYKSALLLPERSAALKAAARKRMPPVQTPPAGRRPHQPVRYGDHEYEPIGQPMMRVAVSQHSIVMRTVAPVVKITDTDVMPVADSDDSIDDRYRFQQTAYILDGDVILPLDGRIEDNVMDGRNMGDQTVDNSADELENPQEFQTRLDEKFPRVQTPEGESRTGGEIITSQVNTSGIDEIPSQKGARAFQQRIKCQAGKIRSRIKGIQKPTFSMPRVRSKSAEKAAKTTIAAAKPPPSPHQKASKMERFRMALPERPKFSLPDKSKFHLPDKSKFHLPDRSKFHLPDKSKFHLPDRSKFHLPERPKFNFPDKSKFQIKKPNIQLPKSLSKLKRSASVRESREPSQQPSEEGSTTATPGKRSIFDFSTYPRPKFFDRKPKPKTETIEYVTSSPKESRSQSTESSTFPRAKKSSLSARWAQRFGETTKIFHDDTEATSVDRSKPWRHPSLEQPRLSLKPQTSMEEEEVEEKLPWENTERRTYDAEDEAVLGEEEERDVSYGLDIKQKMQSTMEPIKDPRAEDEQLLSRISAEEKKKKVTLVEEDQGSEIIDPEAEDDQTYHPKEFGSFPPVDPRNFRQARRTASAELSEDEESMRSDREIQQSSGSSCERRRRGVIEEIDSDEFFLREKGISQENMRFHLINEIRDALRPRADDTPPIRPQRTRSHRKRKEESVESYEATPPPEIPKRERSLRRSQESFTLPRAFERAGSVPSRHRIVYQTETSVSRDEPLDDIVVVKPVRRKSRTSLRSQSQGVLTSEEENILSAPIPQEVLESQEIVEGREQVESSIIPPIPTRRKRLRRDQSSSLSIRTTDSAMYNGYNESGSLQRSHERIPPTPPPTPPPSMNLPTGITKEELEEMYLRQQRLQHIDELDYIESTAMTPSEAPPVPPKRTRSRTASIIQEDDRTSHGADSLPGDFGYVDEDILTIPRDSSSREPSLPGYAVIEKRDKPPRPPPPRRKRQDKFATAPRPAKSGPKRPQRNYSTLRPARSDILRKSTDSMPFIDADYSLDNDEPDFHRDLQSGEVVTKVQGRPLPAPPRPPRHKYVRQPTPVVPRSLPREITPDYSETVASTQTDPLPDDLVIEEEVTTAKLVVTPSRSGSTQILISQESERVPSPGGSYKSAPSGSGTPPIPPLPGNVSQRDGVKLHAEDTGESEKRIPSSSVSRPTFDVSQLEMLRSALFSTDEPIRIPHLEVGDLKVDRLTVSQLEAYKVAASEIDAIVVSATEMSGKSETEAIHPSLLQELIAIRNQLDVVAISQSRPQSAMEDACTATSNERIDIPLDEHSRPIQQASQTLATERRPSFTRESSPLLVVQPPISEREATAERGRTVFPLSGSMSDLTSTASDSITVSEPTVIATEVAEESEKPTIELEKSTVRLTTKPRCSRSRSPSPMRTVPGAVRQTASPVKSLPPVISVTPDSVVSPPTSESSEAPQYAETSNNGAHPQRATISYAEATSAPVSRESSRSPPAITDETRSQSHAPPQFIAFPTSQIPPEFFTLANSHPNRSNNNIETRQNLERLDEPGIAEVSAQLLRALRQAGTRSLRQFVDYVVSRFNVEGVEAAEGQGGPVQAAPSEEKLRRVELAVVALLILIVGLIITFVCTPRTVTHHHHWDYFNPPQ